MKNFTILPPVILLMLSFQGNSQFYGTYWSAYPATYSLGSGFATTSVPGYVWLGYLNTVQNVSGWTNLNKNFLFQGLGQSAISGGYQVLEGINCTTNYSQIMQNYGVAAIECSGPSPVQYAVAGVYNKGVYFVTYDVSGNPITSKLFL